MLRPSLSWGWGVGGRGAACRREVHHQAQQPPPTSALPTPLQPHSGSLQPGQASLWMPTLELRLEALAQTPLGVT